MVTGTSPVNAAFFLAVASSGMIGIARALAGIAMLAKLTVWYNTKCPVCDAGISRQRDKLIAAAKTGAIEFRDINFEPQALQRYGAGVDDVRRRLHATDPDGRLFVGADCAIEIWRRTPGESWLAHIIALPGIRQLARFGYDRFADLLFAWNKRHGRW